MSENGNTKNVKLNQQKRQAVEEAMPMVDESQPKLCPQTDLAATELFNVTNDLVKSLAKTAAEELELRSELKQLLSRYLRDNDYGRYRYEIGEFVARRIQ
jgi:hypothetical protein